MMNNCLTNMMRPVLFVVSTMVAVPAIAAEETMASGVPSNMEILQEKVSADKKLVVATNMNLTEDEAKGFWPVYDAYQKDLQKINVRMVKVINEYALAYNKGAVLNDTAKKLLDDSIAIELDEAKLKQAYVPKLGKVLPAAKVARYIQIENKIRAIVRYELADKIPLAR